MATTQVKRCFIALPLDPIARADIAELCQAIGLPGIRRVNPALWHITVKFLGNTTDHELTQVIRVLQKIARHHPPLSLTADTWCYLPHARRPRVFALAAPATQTISALARAVDLTVSEIGFRLEARTFLPHITLGRFRKPPTETPEISRVRPPAVELVFDHLELIESRLTAQGPQYITLAKLPLAAAARQA